MRGAHPDARQSPEQMSETGKLSRENRKNWELREPRACLKRVGHGATAPARESRRQPGCGRNRRKPGRLGRCPVAQGTQHAVGPPRISFSDSL